MQMQKLTLHDRDHIRYFCKILKNETIHLGKGFESIKSRDKYVSRYAKICANCDLRSVLKHESK